MKYAIYWWETEEVTERPPLEESLDVDVAIVGGGYTGLWTAYQLKRVEPTLDVVILEAEWAGAGASGHNDGYVMTRLDRSVARLVDRRGIGPARAAHNAAGTSVLEIGEVAK